MRILVVYYSFTSTVERLAKSIESCLAPIHDVTVTAIRPVRTRTYWNWLLLSFIPGYTVAIANPPGELSEFDRICIGFPKWTFSCPPVNRYLAMLPDLRPETRLGVFMGFGGFDEDRYLQEITARVSRKSPVVASLAVKRKLVDTPECMSLIQRFCTALVDARSPVCLKLDSTHEGTPHPLSSSPQSPAGRPRAAR